MNIVSPDRSIQASEPVLWVPDHDLKKELEAADISLHVWISGTHPPVFEAEEAVAILQQPQKSRVVRR